jgi:hypothetical protein
MATEAQMEVLSGALTAKLLATAAVERDGVTLTTVNAEMRATNRLLDAAVDCGMRHFEPEMEAWASERVAAWLCSAGEMA